MKWIFAMALLSAACTPGVGEYGACASTPDCQVNLTCKAPLTVNDAGLAVQDGGICRHTCQTTMDCTAYSEVCGPVTQLCSSDGGF